MLPVGLACIAIHSVIQEIQRIPRCTSTRNPTLRPGSHRAVASGGITRRAEYENSVQESRRTEGGPRCIALHFHVVVVALPCCCCCREVGWEVRFQGRYLSMYVLRLGMKVGMLEVRYQGRYVFVCCCLLRSVACMHPSLHSFVAPCFRDRIGLDAAPAVRSASSIASSPSVPHSSRSWRPRAGPTPRPRRRAKGTVPQALPVPVPRALPVVPVPQALPVVPVPQALPVPVPQALPAPVPQAPGLCRSSAGG